MRRRLVLSLGLGGLSTWGLSACGDKPSFSSIDITGAEYAQNFLLPDPQGQWRSLKDFSGKVVVVFFGYTQCPDVCPTTLAEIAQIQSQMGAQGQKVQAVFITVDPERDTPELLQAYAANFGTGVVALRGTPEQTLAIAKQFKVFFAKVPGATPSSYTVDHTAGSYIYDPQGRIRLFSRYGSSAEGLKKDFELLLAGR